MTESWKDRWREHKQETGLTWDEYHRKYFQHEEDIEDLRDSVERLDEHVQAVTEAYDELRQELWEIRTLMEGDK